MIDDVDDKIRRNLLVYAAVILATVWLDAPLWSMLSAKGLINSTIPETKIIVVAIAIQLYLLMRYRFSAQALRSWRRYLVESGSICRRYVISDIAKRLEKFKQNGETVLFEPTLRDYVTREETDPAVSSGLELKMQKLSLGNIKFESTWHGDFSCVAELSATDGTQSIRHGGVRIGYNYSGFNKAILVLGALPKICFYSKGAVELALPISLGFAAVAALAFRYYMLY